MKSRDIPNLIIILTFLIVFIPFVSSAQPTVLIPTSSLGLQVEHPYIETIQAGQDYKFHFHVFNSSTGKPVNISLVTCTFHLYNSSGSHLFKNNDKVGSNDAYDYEQVIKGGNFTKNNYYAFIMSCNSSAEGGFYENSFYVTQNGESLTVASSVLYSMLSLVVFLIFLISLYFSVSLNYKNERNEKGQVTKIEYGKYFKVGLILISYSLFLWFLNILVAVSDNFVNLDIFYGLISGLYLVLLRGFFPVFVIVIIWIIVLAIKDINFKSLMREFNFKWNQRIAETKE